MGEISENAIPLVSARVVVLEVLSRASRNNMNEILTNTSPGRLAFMAFSSWLPCLDGWMDGWRSVSFRLRIKPVLC